MKVSELKQILLDAREKGEHKGLDKRSLLPVPEATFTIKGEWFLVEEEFVRVETERSLGAAPAAKGWEGLQAAYDDGPDTTTDVAFVRYTRRTTRPVTRTFSFSIDRGGRIFERTKIDYPEATKRWESG